MVASKVCRSLVVIIGLFLLALGLNGRQESAACQVTESAAVPVPEGWRVRATCSPQGRRDVVVYDPRITASTYTVGQWYLFHAPSSLPHWRRLAQQAYRTGAMLFQASEQFAVVLDGRPEHQ